jgi:hypothetical protein
MANPARFPTPDELPTIDNTEVASTDLHLPWATSATSTVVGHVSNREEQFVIRSNQEPLAQGEVHTLIPITRHHPAADPVQDNRALLHNLRHVAKQHGCDLEKLHPEVFVSTSPSPQHTPVAEASQPYTLIPITRHHAADPVRDNRALLHNLRHVAKQHGCDLEKLHPEVFASTSHSPQHTPVAEASQPSRQRNRADDRFLDDFDMGNGVDGDDQEAVAREREIA